LLGAAVDRRLAADLLHGRLITEAPAPGFAVLSGGARPLRLVQGGRATVEQRQAKREKAEAVRRARAIAAEEKRAAARGGST
jgi:hypothetical protein